MAMTPTVSGKRIIINTYRRGPVVLGVFSSHQAAVIAYASMMGLNGLHLRADDVDAARSAQSRYAAYKRNEL